MLISSVIPMISLYRLPHGQYGYNGHVINLPQDVASFVNTLPRHPNDLDIIVVRQQNSSESHHDFHVRRSKVICALQWLIANNIYFRNITIDNAIISSLPQNSNLTNVPTIIFPVDQSDESDQSTHSEDPYTADLSRTFVPGLYQSRTEAENVRRSLENSTVMWPNRGLMNLIWRVILHVPFQHYFLQVLLNSWHLASIESLLVIILST